MAISEALGQQQQVQLPQGTITYRERGTGEPIVFVHGALVNADLWRKVVPELSKDFRCIAPDLPLGSHEPPHERGRRPLPIRLARLIADFLEALGLEHVTLVGNDTGGALCQLVVTRHPERVGRLVLTNCDAYDNFPPRLFASCSSARSCRASSGRSCTADALRRDAQTADRLRLAVRSAASPTTSARAGCAPARDAGVRRDLAKLLKDVAPALHAGGGAARFGDFDRPVLLAWAHGEGLLHDRARGAARARLPGRAAGADRGLLHVRARGPARAAGRADRGVRAGAGAATAAASGALRPQRLSRWPSAIGVGQPVATPSAGGSREHHGGREPEQPARPSASDERRDVDLGAVPSRSPRSRPRRRRSGVRVPTPRGSFTPLSANMPASRMKPGNTVVDPDARCRAAPRAARSRIRAGRTWSRCRWRLPALATFPDSDEMKTMWPLPRSSMPGSSARASCIGARRFTSSARSISSAVKLVEPSRLPGSAAFATSTSIAAARRRALRPAAGSARSATSGSTRSPSSAASSSSTSRLRPRQRSPARRGRAARARSPGRCRRSRRSGAPCCPELNGHRSYPSGRAKK